MCFLASNSSVSLSTLQLRHHAEFCPRNSLQDAPVYYSPLLQLAPLSSPRCHAPPATDSDTAACITRGMSSCRPSGSDTTQATSGCRFAAAFMSAGMSEVTCRPGLKKKGCKTTFCAPAVTQRSNASSMLGSASSMCAAFFRGVIVSERVCGGSEIARQDAGKGIGQF